ncbi:signal transduction histidine kinase [Schizothecium vesticola]|uniref:Signal transduction histidine kinase n=1 Tax=Schizothecium vesticola TaxID=314040 RepID=A0AA40JZ58_9PEZI|nr:signal transduction histidine kinase [Schizothecium vesticola]
MPDPNFGEHVDLSTFSQILEMDDEDHDFSKPLVDNFFEQAEETFVQMDHALSAQDLERLSSLGHFLKGSSATLGFSLIRDSCQVIQQYGSHLNVDGSREEDAAVCLGKIREALTDVKVHTAELKEKMNEFFELE